MESEGEDETEINSKYIVWNKCGQIQMTQEQMSTKVQVVMMVSKYVYQS